MSNTTETYWDVNGISLQTYAFNIVTLGDDRMSPPSLRGDEQTVPYRPGTKYMEKVANNRVISMGMWVIGADENGNIRPDENSRRTFDRNWRKLRNLLWNPRKQFTLTKRFWVETAELVAAGVSVSGLPTDGAWSLYSASARGSFAGGLSPTMGGPSRASFTVDILLSDPYFYSEPITIPFSMQSGGAHPGPTKDIVVLGDERTNKIRFDVIGPLDSLRFTNQDADPELWIQYATSLADGDTAWIDVDAFRSKHTESALEYTSSGYVNHFGDRFWFYLDPQDGAGTTTVALSAQAGTGTGTMTYSPAWI